MHNPYDALDGFFLAHGSCRPGLDFDDSRTCSRLIALSCSCGARIEVELPAGETEPARQRTPRRDDGPLPTPLLVDVARMLWRAGFRDWDEDGQEYRVDGDTFDNMREAWEQSREMVAAERAKRGGA